MNSLSAPAHVFTMSGNSTVCTAALKQLQIFERENMNQQVVEKGKYLKSKLQNLYNKYDIIGDIRGIGLSIGVDLVHDRIEKQKNNIAAAKISYNCIENGLLITFINKNTLRIQPPLIISKNQIDKAIDILDYAFQNYVDGKIDDKVLLHAKRW